MYYGRLKLFIVLSFFLIAATAHGAIYSILESNGKVPADGLLVELKSGVDVQSFSRNFNGRPLISNGLKNYFYKKGIKPGRLERIVVVKGRGEKLLQDLRVNESEEYKALISHVEPNLILTTQYLPNDTFLNQSTIFTDGMADAYSSFNMNLTGPSGAWEITQGSPGVLVAVVDTGVDKTHPDLSMNIWTNSGEIPGNGIDDDGNGFVDDVSGWDFATRDNNSDDDNGHGTHVAGLIAAKDNNTIGIAGGCPSCRVVGVKVLSGLGFGTIAGIVEGILYTVSLQADVINMSLGASGYSKVLEDTVNFAFDNDVVVVVAAGNSSDLAAFYSPAGVRRAVTIAAAAPNKVNASFSNYGLAIDIAAPGGGLSPNLLPGLRDPIYNVISLLAANARYRTDPRTMPWIIGTDYIRLAGTSMASPNAAGVAGLVRSQFPMLNADQAAAAMKLGGEHNFNFELSQGHGHLDAAKAMSDGSLYDVRITRPTLIPMKNDKKVTFEGFIMVNSPTLVTLSYRPLSDFSAPFTVIAQNFPINADGAFSYTWTFPPGLSDGDYIFRLQAGNSTDFGVFRKGPVFFTETDPSQFTPGSAYTSAVFDVDGDGDRDIIQGNIANIVGSSLAPAQNNIYIGDGLGNFSDRTLGLLPDLRGFTTSLLTGDFNKDGSIDLFVVNFNLSGGVPHFVLLNDRHGKFTRGGSITFEGAMCGFDGDIGDVDKDGDLDVILAGSCSGGNILLLNDGQAHFVDATARAGFNVGSGMYYGGKLVDVDNDNDLDAIFNTTGSGGALLLINNGNLTFRDASNQLGIRDRGYMLLTVADINKDGYHDFYAGRGLLYINQGRANPGWFTLNRVDEKSAFGVDLLMSYQFGDIDRDGDSDLVGFGGDLMPGTTTISGRGKFGAGVTEIDDAGVWRFVNKSFEYAPKERTFDTTDHVGLADADGDGDLDVMVYVNSIGEGYLQIYYNQILITGDVTNDARVTVIDALKVARAASGLIRLTAEEFKRGDVDYNNRITIVDAQWIAKKAANPALAFPAPLVR
ncbi:MAG: hypothetical protein A3F16_04390 [Deltaproteobacteria bacterium RIFCSPHIGHO2_12_FULL_43_9]|nr:MAG: hypothetical protein A3F16_04390 [Deltaproteobacteria bacterium RIFCSPHIGHO2_12_FULL_43_9]